MALKIVFMGTPDFAVPTLAELIGQGHEIAAVYTRPPASRGRGLEMQASPVHAAASRFGLEVRHPRSLKAGEEQQAFADLGADLAVVVAYGLILPKPVLDAPALGCLNLHASLLPRWRGAAPIQRAVMAGDRESGICVMRMEEGLDTGPVGMSERVAIGPAMTAGDLHDALARLGADLMARAVGALERGSLRFTEQPEAGVTYAAKISNEDARIDWARPAEVVHNLVRGLAPFPGAYAVIDLGKGPERLKLLRASVAEQPAATGSAPGTLLDAAGTVACVDGAVRLIEVQRAGGRAMPAGEFLRGARLSPGFRFG
jgi:methionyl-tRNA formyltransferase